MTTTPTHHEIATWISEKKYLTEDCHAADFGGSLGVVIDNQLTPQQEKTLLKNTHTPPPGSMTYKDGDRSFVGACPVADTTLALKYYHRLNLRRQIGYTMFGSRAMKAWIASRVLTKLGIQTPRPIAILEYRRLGLLIDNCLFATEVAKGTPLPQYVEQYSEDEAKMDIVAANCKNIFDRFAQYRIYHSDTTAKNFIVSDDGHVSVIDLDATRILISPILWKSKRAKDKYRFMGRFRRFPHLKEKFANTFITTK